MREAPQPGVMKPDRKLADQSQVPPNAGPGRSLDHAAVKDLMWRAVGLFRTADRLRWALAELDAASVSAQGAVASGATSDVDSWRSMNLITVARLMARAALRREESRGGHFREDFPERDDLHWKVHLVDQQNHG
jgi:succinate dehydrogenase/fumarate reductase flavoprotein subunit